MKKEIKRGQVYFADLSPVIGSEQGGLRPVIIIQNDIGNKYSPTTMIAIITTRKTKAKLPTHFWLSKDCGLPKNSMVECEQIRTIDKSRLKNYVGTISGDDIKSLNRCLKDSLGIFKNNT